MADQKEPIRVVIVKEEVIDRQPQRAGGILVTTRRTAVDQYNHMWHSIHTDIVFEEEEEKENKEPAK